MNSRYVDYKYYNARSILAIPTRNDINVIQFEDDIIELNIDEKEAVLEKNDIIEITHNELKYKYNASIILAREDKSFLVQESLLNKSNKYVVPCIMTNKIQCLWDTYLYNCYLNESHNRIYLVYRFIKDKQYLELEKRLTIHPNYLKVEEHNNDYVIFEFKVDEKYKRDLELFMKGKYSKMSSLIQQKILAFNGSKEALEIKKVFNKHISKVKELETKIGMKWTDNMEVMSKPKDSEYISYFKKNILCIS